MHHVYTDEEMRRRLKGPPGIAAFSALCHFEGLVPGRREVILEAGRSGCACFDLATALHVSRQALQRQ